MSDRAVSPTVGVALLLVVTVTLAATVGTAALATVPQEPPPSPVALSLSVSGDRLSLTHEGGDSLDVDRLTVHVAVDGTTLRHQPPVPFFSATGFRPGPTGPFNVASDGVWSVGEQGSLRLASTNHPTFVAGARVTVDVYSGNRLVAELSTTV